MYNNIFDLLISINQYDHDNNSFMPKNELEEFIKYMTDIDDLGGEYNKVINEHLNAKNHDKINDIMALYREYSSIIECKKVSISSHISDTKVIRVDNKNILIEETCICINVLNDQFNCAVLALSETVLPESNSAKFISYSDIEKSRINTNARDKIVEAIQTNNVNQDIISTFIDEFTTTFNISYIHERPVNVGDTSFYIGFLYMNSSEKYVFLTLEQYAKYKLST